MFCVFLLACVMSIAHTLPAYNFNVGKGNAAPSPLGNGAPPQVGGYFQEGSAVDARKKRAAEQNHHWVFSDNEDKGIAP